MISKNSTLYLIVTLSAISALILGLIIGCDEKQIKTPVIGPSAGSGPVGGGDAQKIRLTANPSSTITALADAQATAQITAIVENNIGQPMPDGTVVYWTATNGSLDSVTTTTSNGASTVTLTFPQDFTGKSVVTATAGDATGSITIKVVSVTPTPTITPTTTPTTTPTPSKSFIVSAENTTIAHKGTTNIHASVITNGQPDQNVQVTFTVSGGGGVLSANAATTNASGVATVVFTGNNTSANDITVTITASTADGRTGSTTVIVSSGATPTPIPPITPTPTPVISITLTADPISLDCDDPAENTSTLTARVVSGGVPLQNVSVTFYASSTAEGYLHSSSDDTNASGEAEVDYEVTSCPTPLPKIVIFTAKAYGQSATISITINNP